MSSSSQARFRAAYGRHRAAEGRGAGGTVELLALPYLTEGPHARQWSVRARTAERFLSDVLDAHAAKLRRPVDVLDLGAGNGWLCRRVADRGHRPVALDLRTDSVDGLAAAHAYAAHLPRMFPRVAASFEALPFADGTFDIALFNASLHYATDLAGAFDDARRVLGSGGRLAILDSPFYGREEDGRAMVEEKRAEAERRFGELAGDLMATPFVEFLTEERLAAASAAAGLVWRRHRVRYPLWYEVRPALARLRGRRAPSRFDLWESIVP